MSELREAALRWARTVPVFPCNEQKEPRTKRGFYDASSDPAVITAWWCRWPTALIAIPTGERSGIIVLDLDVPNEQKKKADGIASFALLQAGHPLPPHPIIRTRGGGEHHYFSNQSPRQVRNRASKMAPGVDQRGQGGYVIVPPTPGYAAVNDVWPPPPPPAWLLDLMAPKPKQDRKPYVGVPRPMKQFEALVRFAANATEGERNHRAYWAACRMGEAIALGHITEGAAISMIVEAARAAGLPEREATLTAISGVQMGRGNR
jgi:hypothetical protein